MELLANAEYASPAAGVASRASGKAAASVSAESLGSAVATAAPYDVAISSGGGTPPSAASSLVKFKLVTYARSTPPAEWHLEDATKAARIENAVEALELEELQDLVDVDAGEDTAELEGLKGPQRRRFFREVEAFQALVASGEK